MALRSSTSASGNSSSWSLPVPTGAAIGDVMILVLSSDGTTYPSFPSGFTQLAQNNNTLDGQWNRIGYKTLTAADSGTYSAGNGSAFQWSVAALCFSGRTGTPAISTTASNNSSNAAPYTVTANGLTAATGDDLLWVGIPDTTGTGADPTGFTPPTGYTTAQFEHATTWSSQGTAVKANSASGATGTVAGTFSGGASAAWTAWLVAISQAPAGGSGSSSGSVAWQGSATGSRTSSGSHSGSLAWAGSAQGSTVHQAGSSGAVLWTGSATGSSTPTGSATGTVHWTGSATGSALESGSASGGISWLGAATGSATHSGSASGAVAWTGSASGSAPVVTGPPQITNLTSGNSAQGTSPITTASISPTGVVLLAINSYISTGSVQPPDPTISGLGMTWALLGSVATDNAGTDQSTMWLYAGTGTATPGAVTITFASSAPRLNYLVYDVTGSTATGFPVQTATSAANPAAGTSISGSFTSAVTSGNLAFAFIGVESSTPTFTAGSGWTALDTNEVQSFSAAFTETATSGSTIDASWSASGKAGYIAIEIPAGVPPQGGNASGSISWLGSALGASALQGHATGAVAWAGSASGLTTRSGSHSGAITWHGVATGSATHQGAVSGTLSWHGSATGSQPSGTSTGSAAGTIVWHGVANGSSLHSGLASGGLSWHGSATGTATHSGAVSGQLVWVGVATGAIPPTEGAAAGSVTWVGMATGYTPYQFSPPYVEEYGTLDPGIFRKIKMRYGVDVLKIGNSYVSVRRPTPEQISAADVAYLGGHVYTISAQEAAALQAAGYEVTR